MFHRRFLCRMFVSGSLFGWTLMTLAQTIERLYDPEPPVNSAYVRVMLAVDPGQRLTLTLDGKTRIPVVVANQASDYMVVSAGKHLLALLPQGKSAPVASVPLDLIQGRAMTVVFTTTQGTPPPMVLEDKTGSNKLKAMLSVYQFASRQKPLDVLTSDGKTKVFAGLGYGTSAYIAVNPINTDVLVQSSGEASMIGKATLSMTQGGAYSILLLPEKQKIKAVVIQNKVERYTGSR